MSLLGTCEDDSTRPEFASLASTAIQQTERYIYSLIEHARFPQNLEDAVTYAALSGGKRTRPTLVYLGCSTCGAITDAAGALGAAIELVHAFSLVHDDLPCLDNDLLRRGQPTTHAKFGEALGLLAGDALLNLAYTAIAIGPLTSESRSQAMLILNSSTSAMIAGQVFDTLGDGTPDPTSHAEQAEALHTIHMGKTAALIEASCRLGGLAAGAKAGSTEDDALSKYGQAIGLMFQIVDDLIDETGDAAHAGKATGKDAAAGKITYPVVHGVDASQRMVQELLNEAEQAASHFGTAGHRLAWYAQVLADRTR